MNQPNITCPQCNHAFRLDESLAAPIVASTRKEFEARLAQQSVEMIQREAALQTERAAIEKARQEVDEQVAVRLKAERDRITAGALKRAREELEGDLQQKAQQLETLGTVINQQNVKLAEAQKAQVDYLQKQRDLDEKLREVELTVQKKVGESLSVVRERAKKEAEELLQLKVIEKEQAIASMAKQIEELKRKAEQGSQQAQGEALELQLETLLKARFPRDHIEPVPKGEFGGDVLHRVLTPAAAVAGTILWESKRTKSWSDAWLNKLRQDQRAAKADVCIIVSQVVPKGCDGFDLIEGVWVAEPRCAVPVAVALRQGILELSSARTATQGQQTKMERVYQYLTGPHFRQRVGAVLEKYDDMRDDLDRERKFLTKQWAKREVQIQSILESMQGMYGDLQGIAGRSLAEIDGLEPKLLDDRTE